MQPPNTDEALNSFVRQYQNTISPDPFICRYQNTLYPEFFTISPLASIEIPPGLIESGLTSLRDTDDYLSYTIRSGSDMTRTDENLRSTCNAILDKGIKCASLCLNGMTGFYGIPDRQEIVRASTIIANMISNANCKLEYLNLCNSSLTAQELITILEATTSSSSLKCIYIGANEWSKEDLGMFLNFLKTGKSNSLSNLFNIFLNLLKTDQPTDKPNVLILGLHNLLIDQRYNWEEFSQTSGEITFALDQYNLNIAPNFNLDVKLQEDYFRFDDRGNRISVESLYH